MLRGETDFALSWVESKKAEALQIFRQYVPEPGRHEAFWSHLDDNYFQRFEAGEIGWHTRTLWSRATPDKPIVRARLSPIGEGLQVLVYAPDQPGLFARITMSESSAVIRARVMGEYGHVYRRMMPTGHVNLIWSPEVYREAGTVSIGDFLALYDKGHGLDMIRQRWNETHSDQRVMHVFGVVETSIKRGNAAGFAFGARISDLINTIAGPIDALCDIGSGLVTFFTFGLVDPGGCHLEVPTYVGLIDSSASNAGRIGETVAHEMGHTFSLAMPWAQNGDVTDNISHSTHDEISNGECVSGTLNYDASRTIYVQPHVFEPVVDPIAGQQYRPQLSVDDAGITATMWTDRAKSLMSYNCPPHRPARGLRRLPRSPA